MNYKLLLLPLVCLIFCSCQSTTQATISSDSSTAVEETTNDQEDNQEDDSDTVFDPSKTGSSFFEDTKKGFSITLPDTSWSISEEGDDMTSFQSDYGFLDITRTTGDDNESILLPSSKEELNSLLKDSYTDVDFKILNFQTKKKKNDVQYLTYSIHYSDGEASYSVTSIYYKPDISYTVTATLTSENKTILKEVQASMKTFQGTF